AKPQTLAVKGDSAADLALMRPATHVKSTVNQPQPVRNGSATLDNNNSAPVDSTQ
ncbi:hypothetical protein PCASD_03408, partial [Puccinia coronata f. sp. avenae]